MDQLQTSEAAGAEGSVLIYMMLLFCDSGQTDEWLSFRCVTLQDDSLLSQSDISSKSEKYLRSHYAQFVT